MEFGKKIGQKHLKEGLKKLDLVWYGLVGSLVPLKVTKASLRLHVGLVW